MATGTAPVTGTVRTGMTGMRPPPVKTAYLGSNAAMVEHADPKAAHDVVHGGRWGCSCSRTSVHDS